MHMETVSALAGLILSELQDVGTSWNIGTDGALAEFRQVVGDPPARVDVGPHRGTVLTDRGAIAVVLVPEAQAIAWEDVSDHGKGWTQILALCLPRALAGMNRRTTLTEVGPDVAAVRPQDRGDILFDLGLGVAHVDFCVRTGDPDLLAKLRAAEGRNILEPSDPCLETIKRVSPSRVCSSRLGRIEVFQPIASHKRNRPTPVGPHTHLLLDLLRASRCGSPRAPIPQDWMVALEAYPVHPIATMDGEGEGHGAHALSEGPVHFNLTRHRRFQALLEHFGPPGYMEEKLLMTSSVVAGLDPRCYPWTREPAEDAAARVALRQMLHTHPHLDRVHEWLAIVDPPGAGHGPNDRRR